jgi:predicted glutamine amidotransferase
MQLLGVFANDAENLPSLLFSLGNEVSCSEPHPNGDVWCLGYYSHDRALVIRKPGDLVESREFFELASEVRSQVLIGFVREGNTSTPHAPPHRFRNWLFGTVGRMAALGELREKIEDRIPNFIKGELAFETASELAFGMFLRELHERNLLDNPLSTSGDLAQALQTTGETIQMLSKEAGLELPSGGIMATNGRCILLNSQGQTLNWRTQEGLEALPDGPPDPNMTNFNLIVAGLKRFRAVVIASNIQNAGADWKTIESGQTAWVDRQLELQIL